MNQQVFEYLWLDTNLRKALENAISWLFTINRNNGVAKCAVWKTLVRWQSPERGLIPPLDFISYAEESGANCAFRPLGDSRCRTPVAKWRDKGINLQWR